MLDMGSIRDIRKIMKVLPKERQTLLFSATFSKDSVALRKTCYAGRRRSMWPPAASLPKASARLSTR